MRVSDRQSYAGVSRRLGQAKGLTESTLEDLSTQRKLHRVSDNPMGVTRLFRNRASLSQISGYRRNMEYARGFLTKSEQTLASINDTMIRAKTLAIQAANGVQNEETRNVLAKEVKQLVGHLISLGNTTYADKYIFGGFKTKEPVIDSEGNFMGDDGAIFLPFDDNTYTQINVGGRDLFFNKDEAAIGESPALINTVRNLWHHLQDNDPELIRKDMMAIDFHIERVTGFRATIGAKENALDSIDGRLSLMENELKKNNDQIEGADFFETTSNFKRAETTLQSTLLASNKLLQPSLLNFLQ